MLNQPSGGLQAPHWQTTRHDIDLTRPCVMGIVNVTPDSFADGGRYSGTDAAIAHCERLCAEGAHIIDIGGESTRPGATAVSEHGERERVMPVLRHALRLGVAVSLDTRHAALMREALEAGIDIVNDINALRDKGAVQAVLAHGGCGVILMHMQGQPASMQQAPHYADVLGTVSGFLGERAQRLLSQGVARERIVLDPGFGFGKTLAHNIALHRHIPQLCATGFPVLVGWSRKSALGTITGREVQQRSFASVTAALIRSCSDGVTPVVGSVVMSPTLKMPN